MASIFTYDPDPPRVSSPWVESSSDLLVPKPLGSMGSRSSTPRAMLSDYGITKLRAEPQEGPTEYKLHLLLRPRRSYASSSTGNSTATISQRQSTSHQPALYESSLALSSSNQSRQHRLEQLTTQLLWRLQQSSPYHASSTGDLVLPKLPEATESLKCPSRPEKLLVGLEESRGALYEIGVSDDGTFIGLTQDEMDESMANLRAMAASLGCDVRILRTIVVGRCEWNDFPSAANELTESTLHNSDLIVTEALVTPNLNFGTTSSADSSMNNGPQIGVSEVQHQFLQVQKDDPSFAKEPTEQLRITLSGPTTSGKSSLLGTLTTDTLDNGRGKSRLSLLRHRHEIVSGVTSSVAQELIGYKDSKVLNYASGNVTSWTDIHASTEGGRLVFFSDSAGHPRYRRTIVRGLVGWAPHWTVLCIAADDSDNAPVAAGGTSSAQDILGKAGVGVDLAKAHLELCLKLEKPLAIVITKLDLASKSSLRQTLSKILSSIKNVGRIPSIIPPDQTKSVLETDLSSVLKRDEDVIGNLFKGGNTSDPLMSIVPILMTSAAKGTGIRMMHALLQNLPLPKSPTSHDFVGEALNPEQPTCLFHIEDTFGLPASYENIGAISNTGNVVGGSLRFGTLAVGDRVVVGPFPAYSSGEVSPPSKSSARNSPASFGVSSHPSTTELQISRDMVPAAVTKGEWYGAHIVSIRNLRLPVHRLQAGQVGTIGIIFDIPKEEESSSDLFERPVVPVPRLRKGMVIAIPRQHMILTSHTLQAASGFTASFEDEDINSITPGSLVVVYIASIRATARVLRLSPDDLNKDNSKGHGASTTYDEEDNDDLFNISETLRDEKGSEPAPLIFSSHGATNVTFELITTREWIELGSQVLVMPGGGHGLYYGSERGEKGIAGLDGFAGKVVEAFE